MILYRNSESRLRQTADFNLHHACDQIQSLLSHSNRFHLRFTHMTYFQQFFFADIPNLKLELSTWIWRLPFNSCTHDSWNLPCVLYGFSLIKQQLFPKVCTKLKNKINELIYKTKRTFSSNPDSNFISNVAWDSVAYFTLGIPKRGLRMVGWIVIEKPFFIEPVHEKSISHS